MCVCVCVCVFSVKIKREFIQAVAVSVLQYGCTTDFNETPREKAWCELLKDTESYFQHILEASPSKTATVRSLTSHLTNDPSKTIKIYWTLVRKDKLLSDVLLWTPTCEHTNVSRSAKLYIDQPRVDTGCSLQVLPKAMTDRDRLRERINGILDVNKP